ARQLGQAFPWDSAPRYLLRDRDRIYGNAFRIQTAGIQGGPRQIEVQVVTTVAFPVSVNDPPTPFPLTWSRQLAPNRPDSPRRRRNFACFSNPLEIEMQMLIHFAATGDGMPGVLGKWSV